LAVFFCISTLSPKRGGERWKREGENWDSPHEKKDVIFGRRKKALYRISLPHKEDVISR